MRNRLTVVVIVMEMVVVEDPPPLDSLSAPPPHRAIKIFVHLEKIETDPASAAPAQK